MGLNFNPDLEFYHEPLTVANATVRKNPATYVNGVVIGITNVIQVDVVGVIWILVAQDVTADASWLSQPYSTDPDGTILINLEVSDVTGIVPDANVLGQIGGELRIGDGVTTGGIVVGEAGLVVTGTNAWVGADQSGDPRGDNSLDIQVSHSGVNKVASGQRSIAIGGDSLASGAASVAIGISNESTNANSIAVGGANTASGYVSSAFGYSNTSSSYYSTTVGYLNTASNYYTSAMGNNNEASATGSSALGAFNVASGNNSSAIGYNNQAGGTHSVAIGAKTKTTVDDTLELGNWDSATVRGGVVRIDSTGLVQMTMEDSATPPIDGGATAGSEALGNLGRGMMAIHKNGTAVSLYYNNAGTIQSLSLGTLS